MQQRIIPETTRHLVVVSAPFRHPLAPVAPTSGPILLPVIARHSDLTPALERLLRPVALRAHHGDWAARDALFAAFEPKLERMARKIWTPSASETTCGTWDYDDLWQEAWIVFANLLEAWPPHIDVGRYLLANFPWRLRDVVNRSLRRGAFPPRVQVLSTPSDELADPHAHTSSEERTLLNLLADDLEPLQADIFRRHVFDHQSIAAIARDLGIGERTARRHWSLARLVLRHTLER